MFTGMLRRPSDCKCRGSLGSCVRPKSEKQACLHNFADEPVTAVRPRPDRPGSAERAGGMTDPFRLDRKFWWIVWVLAAESNMEP